MQNSARGLAILTYKMGMVQECWVDKVYKSRSLVPPCFNFMASFDEKNIKLYGVGYLEEQMCLY